MSNSLQSYGTTARQAPLSMGSPRQEYWSGLPFPFPRDHPDPGFEPTSPVLAERLFTCEPPGKPIYLVNSLQNLTERIIEQFPFFTDEETEVHTIHKACQGQRRLAEPTGILVS